MTTNRRLFLQQLGATGIVSLGGVTPLFLARGAVAATPTAANGRVLVLVQLSGGNDGLNTVIPHGDPAYYKARPGIGIPKSSVLRIDELVGLHPQMAGFKEFYDEGRLAVVQGVGYESPDRSHFRSMDIWHSARPDSEYTQDGWLGRALDQTASDSVPALRALSLGTNRLPLALLSAKVNVPSVASLAAYHLEPGGGTEAEQDRKRRLMRNLAERPGNPAVAPGRGDAAGTLDFLRRTAVTAYTSAERLREVTRSYRPAATYPTNGLGEKLKVVAQLIAGEIGVRVVCVSLDGFDTHSQQANTHQNLLSELSSAVRAFFQDLQGHGLDDRAVVVTFSEFGRRVQENGSLGTDHGAASQILAVGSAVRGGLYGQHPSLTDLEDGDLKFHTDFRAVYATLLTRVLDWPAEPVLGKNFPLLDFV